MTCHCCTKVEKKEKLDLRKDRPPPGPYCSTYMEYFGNLVETKESKNSPKRYKIKMKLWRLINEDNS